MPIRGPVCLPFDTDAGIEWQPVCTSDELADLPKKVKLLCEELVVFRDRRAASERSSPTAIRAPAELCGLARHVDSMRPHSREVPRREHSVVRVGQDRQRKPDDLKAKRARVRLS
jgi:hypothetical protein